MELEALMPRAPPPLPPPPPPLRLCTLWERETGPPGRPPPASVERPPAVSPASTPVVLLVVLCRLCRRESGWLGALRATWGGARGGGGGQ